MAKVIEKSVDVNYSSEGPATKVIEVKPNDALREQAAIQAPERSDRVPAPMITFKRDGDTRKAILDDLDKKDPSRVHMYQRRDVDDWELDAKGQKLVRDEQGRILHHMGDPVVSVPKEAEQARRLKEAAASRKAVETRVSNERSTVYRSPRTPTHTSPEEELAERKSKTG